MQYMCKCVIYLECARVSVYAYVLGENEGFICKMQEYIMRVSVNSWNAFQYRSIEAFYKSHYKLMGSEKLIESKFARFWWNINFAHKHTRSHRNIEAIVMRYEN